MPVFKRAYAFEEVKRMEAAAKARGQHPASVDSIYKKMGTKEWDAFEVRNGFREPIRTLDMVQHSL